MTTYEVTVPLVVTVKDGNITGYSIEEGFPGFFSEAEDNGGCWNVQDQEWSEPIGNLVYDVWNHVRSKMDS